LRFKKEVQGVDLMRKKEFMKMAVLAMIAMVLAGGCIGQKPLSSKDYFPMKAGTQWFYKIDFGVADPKLYYQISGQPIEATFSPAAYKKTDPDCCHLRMTTQDLKSDNMFFISKLNIIQDDLGILGNPSALGPSWTMQQLDNGFEIVGAFDYPYPADKDTTPAGPNSKPQLKMDRLRLLFFSPASEGDERGPADDRLRFIGYDNNVPEYQGINSMHFMRIVGAIGMTEDVWFAPGKGLIRLEQKVSGRPSMTWTLESFKAN